MLRKSKSMRYGGLWVFPGGKIESEDEALHGDDGGSVDILATAARAAAREAEEETRVAVSPRRLTFISHWVPPAGEIAARGTSFSTFFFVGAHEGDEVRVDGAEIDTAMWLRPAEALQRHATGQLGLLPPTWMTLDTLESAMGSKRGPSSVERILAALKEAPPLQYATRSAAEGGSTVFMWEGDAGWASSDPTVPGPRMRLTSSPLRETPPGQGNEDLGDLARGATILTLKRSTAKTASCL